MSTSNRSTQKAAADRAAAADQTSTTAPAQRQTPERAQQDAASADGSAGSDAENEADAERQRQLTEVVQRLEDAATRAEDAADRAEAAADRVDVSHVTGTGPAVQDDPAKGEPEIGTPEWQRRNRIAALEEELGFAQAKGQKARVADIQAELRRLDSDA